MSFIPSLKEYQKHCLRVLTHLSEYPFCRTRLDILPLSSGVWEIRQMVESKVIVLGEDIDVKHLDEKHLLPFTFLIGIIDELSIRQNPRARPWFCHDLTSTRAGYISFGYLFH